MDPVDQPVADKNGDSTREKKKRGRPRKDRSGIPMEFPLSPQPICLSSPPGFLDTYQVAASRIGILPVDNHTTPAKGLDMNVDDARHNVVSKNLGAVHKLVADGPSGVRDMTCSEYIKSVENNKIVSQIGGAKLAQYSSRKTVQHDRQCSSLKMNNVEPANTGPEHELINKQDNEETVAGQAQRQMHQFSSAFTELCTSFETDKKKIKELEKQVTEQEDQLRKWSNEKARWDDKEKELRGESYEARKEALEAARENKDLKEKIEMASKHVEDSKASAKKADEAVESMKKRYKICAGKIVAALAEADGTSIEAYALELFNEITHVGRAADDRVGYEDDEAMRLRRSQRSPMPNPKYE